MAQKAKIKTVKTIPMSYASGVLQPTVDPEKSGSSGEKVVMSPVKVRQKCFLQQQHQPQKNQQLYRTLTGATPDSKYCKECLYIYLGKISIHG